MRRAILIAMLLMAAAGTVSAELADGPVHTMLWNRMDLVAVVDSMAVGFSVDGVTVSRWSDSLQQFVVERIHDVDYSPVAVRVADSLVMVHTADHRIIAYEARQLPYLSVRWIANPGMAFSDWAVADGELYLSRWFEGIWRYALGVSGAPVLLDTSMVGVLVTQIEADDSSLYVVDEYNGIMRYDLGGARAFLDYLYVPEEVESFAKADSTIAMVAQSGGVVMGQFTGGQSIVQPVLAPETRPQRVYLSGDAMVTVAPRLIEVRDRTTGEVRAELNPPGVVTDGMVWEATGVRYVVLPREDGGLYLVNIEEPEKSGPGLYRSGPIKTLAFAEGKLLTAGGENPIEVYSLDSALTPQLEYTMFPELTGVQEVVPVGDTVLAYVAGLNRVAVIRKAFEPDSLYIERAISLSDTVSWDLRFLPRFRYDSLQAIVAVGRKSVQAFTVDDTGYVDALDPWPQQFGITGACMVDTLLFVATGKNDLRAYRIDSALMPQQVANVGLPSRALALLWVQDHLMVFMHNQYHYYAFTEEGDFRLAHWEVLPFAVIDAVVADSQVYAVGSAGIGVFSLDGDWPKLVELAGDPGRIIAVWGDVLAASDGGSVKIYRLGPSGEPGPELPEDFVLSQNYPNPFNAETVIRFSLPEGAHVRLAVYNVLGQRVTMLVDEFRAAGEYQVVWDGTDHAGRGVASGVYLYQLEAGKSSGAKKMVLVK